MGPLATADLFEKITHLTKADADSKHIHVIIDSDTSIPDRTAAILGLGPDPTDELKAAAKRLENAGADILLISDLLPVMPLIRVGVCIAQRKLP